MTSLYYFTSAHTVEWFPFSTYIRAIPEDRIEKDVKDTNNVGFGCKLTL